VDAVVLSLLRSHNFKFGFLTRRQVIVFRLAKLDCPVCFALFEWVFPFFVHSLVELVEGDHLFIAPPSEAAAKVRYLVFETVI